MPFLQSLSDIKEQLLSDFQIEEEEVWVRFLTQSGGIPDSEYFEETEEEDSDSEVTTQDDIPYEIINALEWADETLTQEIYNQYPTLRPKSFRELFESGKYLIDLS